MTVSARLMMIVLLVSGGGVVFADDQRVRVNYMLNCQGCHLPKTEGFAGRVPPMKDFVGYFLHSREGREFLIRVPGVAQSALDDSEIVELMNWLITTYSSDQLPDEFVPFTVAEVARLRKDPERDPDKTRMIILRNIAANLPPLANTLAAADNKNN